MTDLTVLHYYGAALVITGWIAILAYAGLRGWNGWLALKRAELELLAAPRAAPAETGSGVSAATRIDVADLKERIRKLEAIAAGIDV